MCFLVLFTIAVVLFTVFSVFTLNQAERNIFGYKFFIVESDSMAATDFAAGDVVVIKDTDAGSLKKEDIISFVSQNSENQGEIITHKIRDIAVDERGNPVFITYGTTTGATDESVVTAENVVGKYRFSVPKAGYIFNFLKTPLGYILLILIPFLILIGYQVSKCIKLIKKYKQEKLKENIVLNEEIASLKKELAKLQETQKSNINSN